MTSSLRDLARQRLDHFQRLGVLKRAPSIEWIWLFSALESTIEGRLLEPDIDTLRYLTAEARVWEGVSRRPAEDVWIRIAAVVTSHQFAIVKNDCAWLRQLYATWEVCPDDIGELWRLRAEGEIGLGLAPTGPRPFGWTEEEVSLLEEERFLTADVPQDRVWLALAKRDFAAARHALMEYEQVLAALPEKWEAEPSESLRQILANPDAVFQVQRCALAALLERGRS